MSRLALSLEQSPSPSPRSQWEWGQYGSDKKFVHQLDPCRDVAMLRLYNTPELPQINLNRTVLGVGCIKRVVDESQIVSVGDT